MIIKAREKGQALIPIALPAVALFAFAALAIDGSRVCTDKHTHKTWPTASLSHDVGAC